MREQRWQVEGDPVFRRTYRRSRCLSCHGLIRPGTLIVDLGKGYGALHYDCWRSGRRS
jgi:hypothetical protein